MCLVLMVHPAEVAYSKMTQGKASKFLGRYLINGQW